MLNVMRAVSLLIVLGLLGLATVTAFMDWILCDRPCASAASTPDNPFVTYSAYRELILGENNMIDHRMTWFLTIQGLLIGSFSLVRRGNGRGHGSTDERIRAITFYSMGVFSAVSVGIALFIGSNTIKCIVAIVENTPGLDTQYVIGMSQKQVWEGVHLLLPWNSLPVLFVAAWHLLLETDACGWRSPELERPDAPPMAGPDDAAPEHGNGEPENARGTAMTTGPDDEDAPDPADRKLNAPRRDTV